MSWSVSDAWGVGTPRLGFSGQEPMDARAAAAFFARVSRDLMQEQSEIPTMQLIARTRRADRPRL